MAINPRDRNNTTYKVGDPDRWNKPATPQELKESERANNYRPVMPGWDEIPDEFKHNTFNGKWNKIQSTWFFQGLKGAEFEPKAGIELSDALKHLGSIQGSWDPAHEQGSCCSVAHEPLV